MSIVPPPEPDGSTRWHAPFLAALIFALASCGASDEGQTRRRSADPDEQAREAAAGAPAPTPVPATGDLGRVVRNHQGDGDDLEYSSVHFGRLRALSARPGYELALGLLEQLLG